MKTKTTHSPQYEQYLRTIVKQGPFLRGSPMWIKREKARKELGCSCISRGPVTPSSGRAS